MRAKQLDPAVWVIALWATDAAELEPDEFAAFMEKAQAIDLGIGVHLGTDMEQVKAVLGAADTAGRAKGGYEYTYLFFASAGGPSPKQRHRGGFFAVVNSATLTVTATDEKVAGITFFASPLSSGDAARWAFLTLDGKPLRNTMSPGASSPQARWKTPARPPRSVPLKRSKPAQTMSPRRWTAPLRPKVRPGQPSASSWTC